VGITESWLPLIKVKVGHLILSALLDSGSIRSFMSAELFHQLQQGDSKLWSLHSKLTCESASGEPLQ
jgi:hypothetical protein